MASGLFSDSTMVPGIPQSVTDMVIGKNSCEMGVNAATTAIGIAGTVALTPVGGAVLGGGAYLAGEGIKAVACPDDSQPKTAAAPRGPVSLMPDQWKDMPPAARSQIPPVASSHAPRAVSRSPVGPGTGGLY